jgi:hypothetical protein
MKNWVFGGILLATSSSALPDVGTVIHDDVCGYNVIIETNSGWYVAAEWYGGKTLYEGDRVYGEMTTYGFQDWNDSGGNESRYYIEDYEISVDSAFEELCE